MHTQDGFCPQRAHRNQVIEDDILVQLYELIAAHRAELEAWYEKQDERRTGRVSRAQLEEGLQEVMNLRIPFLMYSKGVDGHCFNRSPRRFTGLQLRDEYRSSLQIDYREIGRAHV